MRLAIAQQVPDDREHGDQEYEHDDAVQVSHLKNICRKKYSLPAIAPRVGQRRHGLAIRLLSSNSCHQIEVGGTDIGRSFERRQHWKLTTAPKIINGATAITAISGESGFGVTNSSSISEIIHNVAKTAAKSMVGTRSQYRIAEMAVAGAIAAPIM